MSTGLELLGSANQVTDESKELFDWISGETTDIPESILLANSNVMGKVQQSMAYLNLLQVKRSFTMMQFMANAEEILFDSSSVITKDVEDLKDLYKEATKTLNQSLEYSRKFLIQNKDILQTGDAKADKLKDLIMSLPAEKIEELTGKLAKGEI